MRRDLRTFILDQRQFHRPVSVADGVVCSFCHPAGAREAWPCTFTQLADALQELATRAQTCCRPVADGVMLQFPGARMLLQDLAALAPKESRVHQATVPNLTAITGSVEA